MQAVIRHVNPECRKHTVARAYDFTRSYADVNRRVPHCGWIENRPVMACSGRDATAGQNSRHVEIHDRRLGQLMCLRSRDTGRRDGDRRLI